MSSPSSLLQYLKDLRSEVLVSTGRLFITFPLRIDEDAREEVVAEIKALATGQVRAPRLALIIDKLLDEFSQDMRATIRRHLPKGDEPSFSLGGLDRDLLLQFVMWLITRDVRFVQTGDALTLLSFLKYGNTDGSQDSDADDAAPSGPSSAS